MRRNSSPFKWRHYASDLILLCEILSRGYDCNAVGTAEEGLELLASGGFDVAITDVKLPCRA
jgi:CheY-like chemotaxis protein